MNHLLFVCFFGIASMLEIIQSPDAFSQQIVEVRGFIYQTEDHSWVLSAEPNLPSCCRGSEAKMDRQIHLDGQGFEESMVPVVIQGKLVYDGKKMTLKDASLQ